MSCLYPSPPDPSHPGYPSAADFAIECRDPAKGKGVYAKRFFPRGTLVARIAGDIIPHRTAHSLQIAPGRHLNDLHFAGYLLHSSDPNVMVDLQALEVWTLQDIAPGAALTMDYASTEDELFRQFPCPNDSRIWITGRKEQPNEEGQRYIAAHQNRRPAL